MLVAAVGLAPLGGGFYRNGREDPVLLDFHALDIRLPWIKYAMLNSFMVLWSGAEDLGKKDGRREGASISMSAKVNNQPYWITGAF